MYICYLRENNFFPPVSGSCHDRIASTNKYSRLSCRFRLSSLCSSNCKTRPLSWHEINSGGANSAVLFNWRILGKYMLVRVQSLKKHFRCFAISFYMFIKTMEASLLAEVPRQVYSIVQSCGHQLHSHINSQTAHIF